MKIARNKKRVKYSHFAKNIAHEIIELIISTGNYLIFKKYFAFEVKTYGWIFQVFVKRFHKHRCFGGMFCLRF